MNQEILNYILGLIAGIIFIPTILLICKLFLIQVEDETNVLICRFGKLEKIIQKPGLHFWFEKIMPWNKITPVSLKRDYRCFEEIHVNDKRGTTIIIDLWIEFRIKSPEKTIFQVENLEKFLQSILSSSATSVLGTFEFNKILSNRNELSQILKADVKKETQRWGIEMELIFISRLSLLPDVSQQLFDTVAAHLEKTKADIEEAGRLEAQLLEAETSSKVAALIAEAKGQYSLSVGKAYEKLSQNKELLHSYQRLYELSLIKPHRTIAFQGFGVEELTSIDSAMTMVPTLEEPQLTHASKGSENLQQSIPSL